MRGCSREDIADFLVHLSIGILGLKGDGREDTWVFDAWGGQATLAPRAPLGLEHMWVQSSTVSVTCPLQGWARNEMSM